MAKIIFDERYGNVSYAQRAAYRKYNVSPSDHDSLVEVFDPNDHAGITAAVKEFSPNGMFSEYDFHRGARFFRARA